MPAGEQFRHHYPGLIPEAVALWRRWLKDHELEFLEFEYNVRCGEGLIVPPEQLTGDPERDRALREQWRALTQKRIDVVGHRLGEDWVLEIDVRPSTRALGQLVLYEQLYAKLRPYAPTIMLGLICERLGPDMEETFRTQGVEIWRVGPA